MRNVWIRGAEHRGVRVEDGRSLALVGVIVDDTRGTAVGIVGAGTDVTLEDVVVVNTRPRARDDAGGRGINVQRGAHLTGTRVIVTGNRDVGVYASGEGTEVTLSDAIVSDTQGARALLGSITGDTTATAVDLTRGQISQTEIGACVQEPGYDIARLSTDVQYTDNGTRLDSTMLPVPMPLGGR